MTWTMTLVLLLGGVEASWVKMKESFPTQKACETYMPDHFEHKKADPRITWQVHCTRGQEL